VSTHTPPVDIDTDYAAAHERRRAFIVQRYRMIVFGEARRTVRGRNYRMAGGIVLLENASPGERRKSRPPRPDC